MLRQCFLNAAGPRQVLSLSVFISQFALNDMASIMQITSAAFLPYDFSRFDRTLRWGVPGYDYT